MVWAYERLRVHSDAAIVLSLSEAIFCYQIDPLYLNPIEKYRFIPRSDGVTLPEGATAVYPWIFFQKFFTFPKFWPIYPTIIETAQSIYLTQYVMPKRDKRYEAWVDAAVKKLAEIAPLPDPRKQQIPPGSPLEVFEAESKRIIGQPLSPWALNVNEAFDSARNAGEIGKMLQAADPSTNPFLRSPDQMHQAGFKGTPYRYPQ